MSENLTSSQILHRALSGNSTDRVPCMKYTSIDKIPDGASIAIADDASNLSVNLEDLASIGLITLAEIPEGSLYTTFDIIADRRYNYGNHTEFTCKF